MPPDPNRTPAVADAYAASAIENELPAYRAIAPQAVVALIVGLFSVLAFVNWYFLPLAALAVLIGVAAERKIQRYPDLFTGRGIAQAGMGLGLVFGLTALTVGTVQTFLTAKQARDFGRAYADVLAKGSFEQVVWWGQNPLLRVNVTPEKLMGDLTGTPMNAGRFEEENQGLRKLKKTLSTPGATIHFEKLENSGVDGLTPWGSALYEIHAPGVKADDQFATAVFKAVKTKKGVWEWWVEKLAYPARPGSVQAPAPKPVDDGHGHAH